MSAPPYTDAQRAAAVAVIRRHRLWIDSLREFRSAILSDDIPLARCLLIEDFELTEDEVDVMVAYFDPGLRGHPVIMREITPAEIWFGRFDEADEDDEEDPLRVGLRYFARRGLEIAEFVTTSHMSGDRQIDRVFFKGESLDPAALDQVWQIVSADEV